MDKYKEENQIVKVTKVNIFLLTFRSVASKLGNIIFDYINSIFIVGLSASSVKIMGLYQSSQSVINIFLNLVGGYFADMGNRKRILVTTDLMSACVCFIASFFLESEIALYIIVVVNIFLAVFSSFNSPAYRAFAKETLVQSYIGKYNSILTTFSELTRVVGPIIGMFLMNSFSVRLMCIFISLTFLVSALLQKKTNVLYPNETKRPAGKLKDVFRGIVEGVVYIRDYKQILYLLLLSTLVNFFLSGYNLLLPYTNDISVHADYYSKCMIAEAAGSIAASFITSKINFSDVKNNLRISIYLLLNGFSLILFYLMSQITNNLILNLIPISLFGFFLTFFNISFFTSIQLLVNSNFLGRVFSVIFTLAVILMPIGSIFFSFVFNVNDIRNFIFIGLGIVVLSISYNLLSKKRGV